MLHDPLTLPRDEGDVTPVGTLVGCPFIVGFSRDGREYEGRKDGVTSCDETCICRGAGAVEKIGFSSYQRLEGYRG